jgi:ribosomal protein S18 acetylase RimI-like enzyme
VNKKPAEEHRDVVDLTGQPEFVPVFTDRDIDRVVRLAQEIWGEHYTPIIGADQVSYMLTRIHTKSTIRNEIDNFRYSYFLIREHDSDIGYLGVQVGDQSVFLSKIYILSGLRARGIGKAAMALVREFARSYGLSKISLTVNKYNFDSIEAYQRFGFEKTGAVVSDIGAGYVMDDYLMEARV